MTGVTKAAMPQSRRRCGSESKRLGKLQWIQRTGAIAPDEHPLRRQILHRATSGVKFNRAIIIGSELANGNKILNKSRRNKNIIKR